MSRGDVHQLLQAVQPCVTEAMNKKLLSEFKAEEIKQALDAIGNLKAPGPDSMPTVFYRKKKLGNSGRESYIKCWVFLEVAPCRNGGMRRSLLA